MAASRGEQDEALESSLGPAVALYRTIAKRSEVSPLFLPSTLRYVQAGCL